MYSRCPTAFGQDRRAHYQKPRREGLREQIRLDVLRELVGSAESICNEAINTSLNTDFCNPNAADTSPEATR